MDREVKINFSRSASKVKQFLALLEIRKIALEEEYDESHVVVIWFRHIRQMSVIYVTGQDDCDMFEFFERAHGILTEYFSDKEFRWEF